MPGKRNADLSKPKAGSGRTPGRSTSSATSPSETSSSSKASSPTEQKGQIDFQFLNISHPSEAKESRARRTVRSHVTRQQHQREHAARRTKSTPQSADSQPTTPQPDSEQEESPGPVQHAATFPPNQPKLALPSRPAPSTAESDASSPSPSARSPSSAGSPAPNSPARIDPYKLYPIEWHPYLSPIAAYYLAKMAPDMPDTDVPDDYGLSKTSYFPFCLTDAASVHAFFLVATAHFGREKGSKAHPIDILQLRGMAMRETKDALEDASRATSDQLIAAVANLASYEAVFGERASFDTHMKGLLRIVSLRGGFSALGLDGLLERILLWIDSNASHMTNSHIYFTKTSYPTEVQHPTPDPQRFVGDRSSP